MIDPPMSGEQQSGRDWPILVFVLVMLLFLANTPSEVLALEQPNIVFVIADDLGWADVAFHGGNAPTPHLDRLASQGLELTQHYVAPVCSPTRAGFLTGRCWSRFGITTPNNSLALPLETVTLPGALRQQGYDTCLVGKWHLGSKPEWGPNHFGFDHSYGSLAGGVSPWNHRYKKGVFSETWHRNEKLLEEQGHVTDLLTSEAVKWIRSRGKSPFFLYVPLTAVHLPLKEPQSWLDIVPESIRGEVPRHYAACVMHLDDSVGKILQALEETGALENTLFIFTSDNGGSTAENNTQPYPDDDCPAGKLPGNNQPFRGQKGTIYEGGTRVPTIVSWPGHITSGKSNSPVYVCDWMPTFCALAGYQTEHNLKWDGANLAPILFEHVPLPERAIYIAGPRWRASSLRLGDWKLVVSGTKPDQTIELFNIAKDPAEKSNRASQEPERVERLMKKLTEAAERDRDAVATK